MRYVRMSQLSEYIADKPEISNTIINIPILFLPLQETVGQITDIHLNAHIKRHLYFTHLKLSISPSVDHTFPK